MPKLLVKARTREPDVTREKLLTAAFEEIYRRGFQAASLDTILAAAGVTKGALYHHFPNKAALGHAVVDEVIKPILLSDWLDPVTRSARDPLAGMTRALRNKATVMVSGGYVALGCPLQNLAQEMSPVDESFRRRINAVFDEWRAGFTTALERGQAEGTVRTDVDAAKTADFIVAAVEGSFGLAKSANSSQVLRSNLDLLRAYVESLRPHQRRGGGRKPGRRRSARGRAA